MAARTRGFVSLLGAGPGDPELITERAARRLEAADLVLYDALAHPSLLERATKATLEYVGKRAGRQSARQARINKRLIEAAEQGLHVVRLKGGDPYLFGRGSEEAEALAEAGVAFEVVPGVPSPLAATAYAGISLTHRDLASSVAYLTATESPDKDRSSHEWSKLATATETLVIFMGMRKLRGLMQLLIEHGRPANTPAAVVHAASLPAQRTVVGTVETIADLAEGLGLPSLIVVGDVVTLRKKLRWFDQRPLFGKKIMVPRPPHQAGALATMLRERGATPLCEAAVELEACDAEALVAQLRTIAAGDWVVFTSANAVDYTLAALKDQGLDVRVFGPAQMATIGKKTARALRARGFVPDLVAEDARAEGLRDLLLPLLKNKTRVFIPRAEKAREVLPEALREAGHEVHVLPAYRHATLTDERREKIAAGLRQADAVALTSASIAASLHHAAPEAFAEAKRFSIGPVTTAGIRELGFDVAGEAAEASIESLVEAIEARYEQA